MKFAFILNTDGGHPDTYALSFTGELENHVYGVTGVEEGVAFGKKLVEDGYEVINLCGDFTAEHAAEIAVEGVKVRFADYLPAELEKIEALEDLSQYGMIIKDVKADTPVKMSKIDPACNVYVRVVKDVDDACEAAKDLLAEGVTFMELCSWFDQEKTEQIIEAIDGKVPVGTCGVF